MAWGLVKALFGKGADSGIGGAAQGIGKGIANTAKVWKVGADANDQRVFDSFANARSYVAQSWLGKQIRPWATILVLLPFLALSVKLFIAIIEPLFVDMSTADADASFAKAVAGFDQLGYLYYAFAGTVMTFWFGGQGGKYTRAHKEAMANADRALAATGAMQTPTDAPEGGQTPHKPRKPALDPEIEAFNAEARDDFFERQARDR